MQSEPPPVGERETERLRRRVERILPVLIKRALETGLEKLSEGPENVRQLVSELKLPKEILAVLLTQADETKNGIYRVVAKEIRDFLDHTNVGEELARVLTTLSFEVKMEVRFIPNDSRLGATPDVRSRMRVKKNPPDSERKGTTTPPPPNPEPKDETD